MPEHFLELPGEEREAILQGLATKLGRSAMVLEKDVWVCWALQCLFSMPDHIPMAFKGGTSLSKAFNAIDRFSEDIDITLDYRGLDSSFDPFDEGNSKKSIKRFNESLKTLAREYTHNTITPYIREVLAGETYTGTCKISISDDGEQLRLHYPSALAPAEGYIASSVLLEFGGRNIIDPNTPHKIYPDISLGLPELLFPVTEVNVLSPARTFWEKATLIHVECNRGGLRQNTGRLSRHWYDLSMLADHNIGERALAERGLLEDVVKHKKVFFDSGYANYDACLSGGLKLLPEEPMLSALRSDFNAMLSAGMFSGDLPVFDKVIARLQTLAAQINQVD